MHGAAAAKLGGLAGAGKRQRIQCQNCPRAHRCLPSSVVHLAHPHSVGTVLTPLSMWLRTAGFLAALAGILSLIMIVPAIALGVSDRWEVWAGALFYWVFFTQGTGLRAVRHGEFADRKRDRQVRSARGRFVAAITVPGLLLAHWISIAALAGSADVPGAMGFLAVAGVVLAFTGLVVNYTATRTLGRFFDRLTVKEGHELITHGIYGVVRHPIYTSYLCLFFSFPLVTGSLWGLVAMGLVCAIWFGNRIPTEEAMLEEAFGQAYQSYRESTKRLIPLIY